MKPLTQLSPSLIAWILTPLSLVAAVAAVYLSRAAEARGNERIAWDEEEFAWVRHKVADTYVDEIGERQSYTLFNSAIDGYLRGLPDEYNDFIPPEEYRKWQDDTAGHYAGVGVKIRVREKEGLELIGVYPGGPASKAGLRIGEVVTAVEGRSLGALDLQQDQNVRMLKGPVGSQVRVTVRAARSKVAPAGAPIPPTREAVIVRDTIRPPTVFARRLDRDGKPDKAGKIGYIRIAEFVEATAADFDAALDAFVGDGATGVKSVILDLRENGGGVLPATVHVADRFVREGEIVRMRGRAPGSNRSEIARDAGTVPDAIGLVVLVNGKSASASEVLAGCLQDHRRGAVLGTRTYGKFLVQNITEIKAHDAAVKITTARYMTPNGRSYARDPKHPEIAAGLTPDVVVEMSSDDKERLEKAFVNAEEAVWGAPSAYPEVPSDWVDPQLRKALDMLAGNLLLQEIRGSTPRNG